MLWPLRNCVALNMFGIYTLIIISTVFPLLYEDRMELLGCLNELWNSNIQYI